jgi:hypothetical protein
MNYYNVEIPIVSDYVSLTMFAKLRGIHRATLERLVSQGLVKPAAFLATGQPLFRKIDAGYEDPVCRAVARPRAPRQPSEFSGCYR